MNCIPLQEYYGGFFIQEPIGNNAFSYENRINRKIYVAPLIEGGPQDLQHGDHIVFNDFDGHVEQQKTGLKHFLYFRHQDKDIFIFDNHNHAFFFWASGVYQGKILPEGPLVHVDQHKDTRRPGEIISKSTFLEENYEKIFRYTNRVLNVGNFIVPAIECGLFKECWQVTDQSQLALAKEEPYVLDLDMDFFAPMMDYIPFSIKMEHVKRHISKAAFITIATSPFFMDQTQAFQIIQQLFDQ
ncbi:MAG: UPF0489 family protein [Candidatus Omnitrophica bacterium]|nr:UPF0489 family protein [Candidatus Omnitrophota bacterium]